MKIAKSKPREVQYVIFNGTNQTEVAEFFNNDRSLFEWYGGIAEPRKLVLKQDRPVYIDQGSYIWLEDGVYYYADKANFLNLFDV